MGPKDANHLGDNQDVHSIDFLFGVVGVVKKRVISDL